MDQQSTESGLPRQAPGTAAEEGKAVALKRRQLLRAGAGAAPVLLTLASRPVSAGTCTVASSFVSVSTFKSRNPGVSAQCSTRTCEWYKTECTSGTTYKSYMDTTTVGSAFGATSPASTYATRTLSSMMKDAGGIQTASEIGVIQHLITLGMNISTGNATTPGNLSTGYLQGMWANYKANGNIYKLPSSGINWDSAALVTWARMLIYPAP